MFSKAIEEAIREAIERGEFDQLPGAGKRIDLNAYFETPEELRLAFSLLRNAGFLPQAVELVQQIGALEEQTKSVANGAERPAIGRRLRDLHLRLGVLMDVMKHKRRAK